MMAAKTDAQLERLNQLRAAPSSPEALAELEKALRGKASIVAAKAAAIAEAAKLEALEPALAAALEQFLAEATDKGCLAKTAIAKALVAIETRSEAAMLAGARHVQMEPTWGGATDVAVELRGVCAAGLVNMRSRHAMGVLVNLLADKSPAARALAVRALVAHGGDAAEALVRYKLLVGDEDYAVMAECFPAAIALTRSTEPVEPFLDSPDDGLREAAILAIGESRLPRAFELLRDRWDVEVDPEMHKLLAMSIALTRQPAASAFLIGIAEQSDSKAACVAIEALGMYRTDDAIRSKLSQIAEKRGGDVLRAFGQAFSSR
jgi:hypothetical protein